MHLQQKACCFFVNLLCCCISSAFCTVNYSYQLASMHKAKNWNIFKFIFWQQCFNLLFVCHWVLLLSMAVTSFHIWFLCQFKFRLSFFFLTSVCWCNAFLYIAEIDGFACDACCLWSFCCFTVIFNFVLHDKQFFHPVRLVIFPCPSWNWLSCCPHYLSVSMTNQCCCSFNKAMGLALVG